MNIQYGNMWDVYDESDLFLITTNSFIKRNGALVMGAGIARQARDRFPGLDLALGRKIKHLGKYGLIVSEKWPDKKLGAFQVKYHFKDRAELNLISHSTEMLMEFIETRRLYSSKIHLNFPGIGNGKLDKDAVLRVVEVLPDCVTLWERYEEDDGFDYNDNYFLFGNDWSDGHPLDFGYR